MIDMLKSLFLSKTHIRRRRFLISPEALSSFAELSKSSQSLLIAMLNRIRSDADISALIVVGDYHDFGYTHRTNFYRDRKRLKASEFLYYKGNEHIVNPCMLEYHNKKQKQHLIKEFGMKSNYTPKPFGMNNK